MTKVLTKDEKERQFGTWPVEVGFPEGKELTFTDKTGKEVKEGKVAILEATSFAIARYMAYAIAQQGLVTYFPKEENRQLLDSRKGWYQATPTKVQNMTQAHKMQVSDDAGFDRAILAARENRARGRLGPVMTEMREIAEHAINPQFRSILSAAVTALAQALAQETLPENVLDVGVVWRPDHGDIVRAAFTAWEIAPPQDGACVACGRVHNMAHAFDASAILSQLEEMLNADDTIHERLPDAAVVARRI